MKLPLFILCVILAVHCSSCAPFDIGGWFKNAAKSAGNWIDGAVKDTKDWVNGAAKDTENWAKGAAKDTKDWVNGAAKDTENWVKGAAKDTENWVKGAAKDTENWVKGAAKDTKDWVNGAARDTERWVNGAVRDSKDWIEGAARDVEMEFNKIGRSITDFFNNAGKEITKAFKIVKDNWDKFERDANNFFKNAGKSIKQAFEDIKKRIEETGDSIVKVLFEKIYDLLQAGRSKLQDFSEVADVKFESAMTDVREKLFSATSQIQNFLDRMRSVVKKKQEKDMGMAILDRYVRESTQTIESCSDAAIEPIREVYTATKALIGKTLDKLEEFLKDIEGCLENGASPETIKCGNNLKEIAKSALSELGGELLSMKATLLSAAFSEVGNMVCVARTRIQVEWNKNNVESAINSLK